MNLENYSKTLSIFLILSFLFYLGVGGYFFQQQSLDAKIELIDSSGVEKFGRYSRLEVNITNNEEKSIKPVITLTIEKEKRFFLWNQSNSWLKSGETRTYTIRSPGYKTSIPRGQNFQVRVNNYSGTRYAISPVYNRDIDYKPIFNPDIMNFTFDTRPKWKKYIEGKGLIERKNSSAVLKAKDGNVRIFQYTDLPSKIYLSADTPVKDERVSSGIVLNTLRHDIQFVFSNVTEKKFLRETVMLPRDRNSWMINIQELYKERNWSLNVQPVVSSKKGPYEAEISFFLESEGAGAEAELLYLNTTY